MTATGAGRPIGADVCIVGGGILGLATALRLLEAKPGPAHRRSSRRRRRSPRTRPGHNSGVVHAGLYYPPGSLKAQAVPRGQGGAGARSARQHGIPVERMRQARGRDLDEDELERFAALKERALANGVDGLEEVGPERLREIEPHAAGIRALWSPGTGIVDYLRVALAYADEVRAKGGTIETIACRDVHHATWRRDGRRAPAWATWWRGG